MHNSRGVTRGLEDRGLGGGLRGGEGAPSIIEDGGKCKSDVSRGTDEYLA